MYPKHFINLYLDYLQCSWVHCVKVVTFESDRVSITFVLTEICLLDGDYNWFRHSCSLEDESWLQWCADSTASTTMTITSVDLREKFQQLLNKLFGPQQNNNIYNIPD